MDTPSDGNLTCERIQFDEIQEISSIGEGSFGQVFKGTWRGMYVAMKRVNAGLDDKEDGFNVEIRQLSRTDHVNIVKLYGACMDRKILVMEYADGGSLYKLLHGSKCNYGLAHAMSWVYQCAKGVEYLHSMKPTPLIHRDLKPPNLLLFNKRLHLKICDFGTVADKRTYMTNNKGSAAWMAPEVFSTSNYVEKCDVYSWSIIFWEVLSRRIPFNRKAHTLSVLWSVYQGKRPPALRGCPEVIASLIVRCWGPVPESRPTMSQIVKIMDALMKYVPNDPEPVVSEYEDWDEVEGGYYDEDDEEHIYEEIGEVVGSEMSSRTPVRLPQPDASMFQPLRVDVNEADLETDDDCIMKTMPGFDIPRNGGTCSTVQAGIQSVSQSSSDVDTNLDPSIVMQLLDPHLRPATPDKNDPRSMALYQQHLELAEELCKVQTERALLSVKKQQLLAQQTADLQQLRETKERLLRDKQSWLQTKRYLEDLKQQKENRNQAAALAADDWVIVNGTDNR